jgi:hypothetical protein
MNDMRTHLWISPLFPVLLLNKWEVPQVREVSSILLSISSSPFHSDLKCSYSLFLHRFLPVYSSFLRFLVQYHSLKNISPTQYKIYIACFPDIILYFFLNYFKLKSTTGSLIEHLRHITASKIQFSMIMRA